jgi:hypothetical protein
MAMRSRWIELCGLLVATWMGCSGDGGKSVPPRPAAHAGQPAAGIGNSAGEGASGGNGGMIGTGAFAGTLVNAAGTVAAAGRGGSAGAGVIPDGWACNYSRYGDGKCDCGCGMPDSDCTAQDLDHCEVCNGLGSCNLAACPGHIDPEDVTKCVPPPPGWTCTPALYGDGQSCDCGCGIQDADCPDADPASCDNCRASGSCTQGFCPSTLAPDDNTRCQIPAKWTCDGATYGDGTCNCGCGVVDVDCPDATDASCETCDGSSCSPFGGCAVEPDDNAHCPNPPGAWTCSPRLYHDGVRCDCGCGAVDPDCESSGPEACDRCDAPGSCSAQPCPGLIDAQSNGRCDMPAPPSDWTCPPSAYADGLACDCGCGAPDPDCRTTGVTSCARCLVCGGNGACEGMIDLTDTTQCAPPPADWTCSAAAYRDQTCDCGCGILDVFCQDIELSYVCGSYPVEGCSGGNKSHIDPNHNPLCLISVPADWTCDRSFYDDGLCDCGCGSLDLDCPSDDVTACEQCDDEGSCSSEQCPGTIVADDTARCSN